MNKFSDAVPSYAGFLLKAIGSGRLPRPGRGHRGHAEAHSDEGMVSLLCGAGPGDPQDNTADWLEAMMADVDPPSAGAAH